MTSYVTLRKLTEPTERDIDRTFGRMAELLRESGESGRVHFRIVDAQARLSWSLDLNREVCHARAEAIEHPDLEVVTRRETWWQMAEGSLSPLDAIFQGKLAVRGDVELGKRLLKKLASSEGEVDIC